MSTLPASRHPIEGAGLPTWLCLYLLLPVIPQVSAGMYDSIASLTMVFDNEDWLLGQVETRMVQEENNMNRLYLIREEDRLQKVKAQLREMLMRSDGKKAMSGSQWRHYARDFIGHPINAFNLIKSWVELSRLIEAVSAHFYTALAQDALSRGVSLPKEQDYRGALNALVRLQLTYDLPAADMAAGNIHGHRALQGLAQTDMLEIAKALMDTDHSRADSWFQILQAEGVHDVDTQTEIHTYRMTIFKQAGDFKGAIYFAMEALRNDIGNETLILELRQFRQDVQTQTGGPHTYWKSPKDTITEHYESLCRADNINNTITRNRHLMCVYRTGTLPYVQYKEEIHSLSPRISLLIDVITDQQIKMLQQKAFPELSRALIGYGDPNEKESEIRVAKLAWLFDTDPELKRLSEKVSDITGLSTTYRPVMTDSEPFQVQNYGMGGQYQPHFDFAELEDISKISLGSLLDGTGDRISTFMFYLSDVLEGGATVFTEIGVRVPPVKKAAAYWYNFRLDGSKDTQTRHAGCPVLLGEKWVANKWIRQEAQMFRRPCALDEDQDDPIWYP